MSELKGSRGSTILQLTCGTNTAFLIPCCPMGTRSPWMIPLPMSAKIVISGSWWFLLLFVFCLVKQGVGKLGRVWCSDQELKCWVCVLNSMFMSLVCDRRSREKLGYCHWASTSFNASGVPPPDLDIYMPRQSLTTMDEGASTMRVIQLNLQTIFPQIPIYPARVGSLSNSRDLSHASRFNGRFNYCSFDLAMRYIMVDVIPVVEK